MASVTKNRNFFNCPLLLYYKSKWAQILTAATWQWQIHSYSSNFSLSKPVFSLAYKHFKMQKGNSEMNRFCQQICSPSNKNFTCDPCVSKRLSNLISSPQKTHATLKPDTKYNIYPALVFVSWRHFLLKLTITE